MCFNSGGFGCNRSGAICALALSQLCEPLLYCILGGSDGSRCAHKLSVLVQICASVHVQLWEFLPDIKGDINYSSQDTIALRVCVIPPDVVIVLLIFWSHHIFHLLNYVSIWVILSTILLYNSHTSASLRQSSHQRSMNFDKVMTFGSFLVPHPVSLSIMFTVC